MANPPLSLYFLVSRAAWEVSTSRIPDQPFASQADLPNAATLLAVSGIQETTNRCIRLSRHRGFKTSTRTARKNATKIADRPAWQCGNAARKRERACHQRITCHDFPDQTPIIRLSRIETFTEHDQFTRALQPDDTRQQFRPRHPLRTHPVLFGKNHRCPRQRWQNRS